MSYLVLVLDNGNTQIHRPTPVVETDRQVSPRDGLTPTTQRHAGSRMVWLYGCVNHGGVRSHEYDPGLAFNPLGATAGPIFLQIYTGMAK